MFEGIKSFFSLWLLRLKILAFMFAIWAVIFATNTVIDSSVAYEYDDGLVYSGDLFRKARFKNVLPSEPGYWEFINKNHNAERIKLLPFLSALAFRLAGFRIDILADRSEEGSLELTGAWRTLCKNFYFIKDHEQKYSVLEKNRYFIFFPSSDEGIIQARKAGVRAVRIKRSPKSASTLSYNPGKFSEKMMPLSSF